MADDQVTQTGEKSTKALSAKLEKVVEELEKLTVLELSEVVQALQERWGVSATPVAGPAVSAAPAEAAPQATGGVQTVVLTNSGGNKIAVIKTCLKNFQQKS